MEIQLKILQRNIQILADQIGYLRANIISNKSNDSPTAEKQQQSQNDDKVLLIFNYSPFCFYELLIPKIFNRQ